MVFYVAVGMDNVSTLIKLLCQTRGPSRCHRAAGMPLRLRGGSVTTSMASYLGNVIKDIYTGVTSHKDRFDTPQERGMLCS